MAKVNDWDTADVEEIVTHREKNPNPVTAWFRPWRQEQPYDDERRGTSAKIQRFLHGLEIQSFLTMKVKWFFNENRNPACR